MRPTITSERHFIRGGILASQRSDAIVTPSQSSPVQVTRISLRHEVDVLSKCSWWRNWTAGDWSVAGMSIVANKAPCLIFRPLSLLSAGLLYCLNGSDMAGAPAWLKHLRSPHASIAQLSSEVTASEWKTQSQGLECKRLAAALHPHLPQLHLTSATTTPALPHDRT
jgi:hypothetical protein